MDTPETQTEATVPEEIAEQSEMSDLDIAREKLIPPHQHRKLV